MRQCVHLWGLTKNDGEHRITIDRQRLQRTGEQDLWSAPQPPSTQRYAQVHADVSMTQAYQSCSFQPPYLSRNTLPAPYTAYPTAKVHPSSRDPRQFRQQSDYHKTLSGPTSSCEPAHMAGHYRTDSTSSTGASSSRSGYQGWGGSVPVLHRTSSVEARLNQLGGYYAADALSSAHSLPSKQYPQRRPSNRDEFDGPSQLLDKLEEPLYEAKEEELPQLPVTLYAQEQDEILSKVNDRLSRCAFDFVAKYQFPVPIEPDKRPVRVPGDREWSEWVYLLKRLATKRRIPARVLYNGQIKQFITILENSLEMRHAAKHQSRPLKDDRNILQLVSSGLQVAKILKDAPAMQYLDSLYVQTESLIQSRRAALPTTSFSSV